MCLQTDFRYIVTYGIASKLIELLQKGELDMVISPQRFHEQGLEYVLLEQEEFQFIGPADLSVPEYESLLEIENWMAKQTWISYGSELPIIRRYWLKTFENRPKIVPKYIFPDLRVILKSIEKGAGVSILPSYLCRESLRNGLIKVLWQQTANITNEIWLVTRRSDRNNQIIMSVVQSFLNQTLHNDFM